MPPSSTLPGQSLPPRSPGDDVLVRLTLAGLAVVVTLLAYLARAALPLRGQGAFGIVAFLLVAGACSTDVRSINWRTVVWGIGLQVFLALLILKVEIGGVRPGYAFFSALGSGVGRFLSFTNAGSAFVFGGLADPEAMSAVFPGGFVFAFTALPTIIFISSFFTVLYHFGLVQWIVRVMARAMVAVMHTSGAETLCAAANVFMGHTEAPIMVRPYVPGMTRSELVAMMVGGMATISGGVMAVYISLGADPVAILTTSVMAAPAGLYLAKILYPEVEQPATRGVVRVDVERTHVNVIDAAAAGASDGTVLAINVAAMLIAFLAFLALFDFLLGLVSPGLSLAAIFGWVFAPLAVLMGTPPAEVPMMADLLGTKLVANEFVAFVKLTSDYQGLLSERSHVLATFALTGFANFGSIGILLGGIGAMAPTRRADLARLAPRALLGGFLATLINACLAATLI